MTIDRSVAARLQGRSLAWRLGAATTAAIGIVLTAWALSIDFVEGLEHGFFGDAATYYTLGHSLADDLDFEYQRDDLVRVWEEFPAGPKASSSSAAATSHSSSRRPTSIRCWRRRSSGCSAPTASWCLHALLMTLCFACAYAFLVARAVIRSRR